MAAAAAAACSWIFRNKILESDKTQDDGSERLIRSIHVFGIWKFLLRVWWFCPSAEWTRDVEPSPSCKDKRAMFLVF